MCGILKWPEGMSWYLSNRFQNRSTVQKKVFDREYPTQILFIKISETNQNFSSQIINSIKLFVKHQIFDNKIFNTWDKNMFAFTHLRSARKKLTNIIWDFKITFENFIFFKNIFYSYERARWVGHRKWSLSLRLWGLKI